jgi:hypothetical protein
MNSTSRAVRYRRLALAEPDPKKAKVLHLIADEADRGVLATAKWMTPAKFDARRPFHVIKLTEARRTPPCSVGASGS